VSGLFIFVLDRGFVVVGEAELHEELALCWHMPRSRTIRGWGTSEGLAELADGPLPGTVLDAVCERSTPFRAVLDIIHLTARGERAWRKALGGGTTRTPRRASSPAVT
jgi:hypothetical protein